MQIRDLKQPVYLFPFTAEAALMYHILKNHGVQTAGFLDNKEALYGERYDGVGFMPPQGAEVRDAGGTVVICGYKHYGVEEQLRESGLNDIVKIERILDKASVESAIGEIDKERFNRLAPRQKFRLERLWHDIRATILPMNIRGDGDAVILNSATFFITTRCTLRCRNCANLIQYYKRQKHSKLAAVIEDIDLLFSKADFAREIVLLGGEPLTHPDLLEIIKYAYGHRKKYGILRIVTNGTIVPDGEMLDVFKATEVFVKISDYGDLSIRKDVLIDKFGSYGIPYQLEKTLWSEVMQLMNEPRNDSEGVFSKCYEKNICSIIMNGRFYRCAFLAPAEDLKAIPYSEENSFDLKNTEFTKKDFMDYIYRTKALPGCDYCTGGDNDHPLIAAAEQTREVMPYKMFNNYPPEYNNS